MSYVKTSLTRTVVCAAVVLMGANCHAQDTRTGVIVNAPVVNGKTTIIALQAQADASVRRLSGSAGGADILDGSVDITNARTGNVTNAARRNGDATVIATGQTTLSSISVKGGARTGDITNAPQRNGNVTAIAGGVEGSTNRLSASAGTTGGVTIDSVRVCGGRTANITNAGQVNGNATYIGGNVSSNSVTVGCN